MIYHEAIHQSTGGMTNAQGQQRERIILRGGERGGLAAVGFTCSRSGMIARTAFAVVQIIVMIGQRPLQKLHVLFTLAAQLNV